MSKKLAAEIWRFVSKHFLIFEKRNSKKIAPGIFRFLSALFNIWKRDEQKNGAGNLKIR